MTRDDLLRDPSFRNWADGGSGADALKWDAYLNEHPEEEDLLLTVREMIKNQPFVTTPVAHAVVSESWQQTRIRILKLKHGRRRRLTRILAAAAIGLILVSASAAWIFQDLANPERISVASGPGEVKTVTLGDGSLVMLNGNSEITYPAKFSNDIRTVRLNGEAYFDVKHLDSVSPFVVSTDEFEVRVLGTTFNVNARPLRPSVSLVDGKVEVRSKRGNAPVALSPGQTAEFRMNTINIVEDDVQARILWRNHIWAFDETPFSDILLSLKETFDVRATVENGVNVDKTISGKLSTQNLGTLYKALEAMFGVAITGDRSSIVIKNDE